MARYASLTLRFFSYVATGCYLDLTLQGTSVRFLANTGAITGGPFRIFNHISPTQIVDGDSQDMRNNVNSIVNTIQGYLQEIGETRYLVTGEMTRDNMGFPQGGIIRIVAREYDPALNLNYTVYNVPNQPGLGVVGATTDVPVSLSVTSRDVFCYSGTTGSATVEVSGGYPPYAFMWSDGSTEQNRDLLSAGIYALTVTDSPELSVAGNTPSEVRTLVTIGSNPQIVLSGTTSGDTIQVQVSGGVGPYSFEWSDGSTEQNRSGLATGEYSLTVTDSVGCQQSAVFRISPSRFYFSKNPIPISLSAADPQSKPNLTFLCEVWVEREYLSEVFERVVELEHPADAAGNTTFDVSEYLDVYLKHHLPEWGDTAVRRADGVFLRFQVKSGEKYGTPAMGAPFLTTDVRYVIKGGLSWEEHAYGTFFESYRPIVKNFFTWQPEERKKVVPAQPEYLYFMPDSFALSAFKVKVKAFFSDGSSLIYDRHTQADLRRFELYCIPCGHDQLGLSSLKPGQKVTRYKVWVADESGAFLSEVRQYVVRHDYVPNPRFLLYANSLGGCDTLLATGHATHRMQVTTETVERTLGVEYDPLLGNSYVASKTADPILVLSLGNLSLAERRALSDVRLTEMAVLVTEDRYQAGELTMKSDEVLDEYDGLKAVEVEFRLSTTNRFTPALKRAGYAPITPNLD